MKNRIAELAYSISNSRTLENYKKGIYHRATMLDMNALVKEFNKGNYSIIMNNSNLKAFIDSGTSAYELLNLIVEAKRLLSYKKYFYFDVLKKKNTMTYNPSEKYCHLNHYCPVDVTYGQVDESIKTAEELLKDNRIYAVLNYYLKYESLIRDISDMQDTINAMGRTQDSKAKLFDLLKRKDNVIGIVRVEDTDAGVKLYAGTRRDMAMSDLCGLPYLRDRDEEGYDYGPYGDYYMPPKKTTKTFHENGETPLHTAMIKSEKIKRSRLALIKSEEPGYIKTNIGRIFVTRKELAEVGVCPDEVKWTPLRLEIRPKSISQVSRTDEYGITTRAIIGMKKELLLKGRK